jgi:L-fuconolactonase
MIDGGRVIDSHLHLWDLKRGDYDWLTPEAGELYASFLPTDAERALSQSPVDGAVLVQAADSFRDTRYLLDVAAHNGWVAGVVGWVQLDHPDLAREQLDEASASPAFRGVRHLVHDDPRADFLELAEVRRSLQELQRRELGFDIPDAWPGHLASAARLAQELPDLRIVIDHLGKPPRAPADFGHWRTELSAVAAHDRVVAKLSGLREASADFSARSLTPIWDIALSLFGPDRLLWGSDYPISTGASGYSGTFDVLHELISTLSPSEQERILGGTATDVYSLDG